MSLVLATTRDDIANYVQTVFYVYSLLIIAYILSSLYFAFGGPSSASCAMSASPTCRSSAASSRRSARWTSAR